MQYRAIFAQAAVAPFNGREISGWRTLGLDPDRIYHMLRDPLDLAASAVLFTDLPVLRGHPPQGADLRDWVVGRTGDVTWEPPYVFGSLTILDRRAIQQIENGTRKCLSATFTADAVMRPGVHAGRAYDGFIWGMLPTSVSLVTAGRNPHAIVGPADAELIDLIVEAIRISDMEYA
jgi:hypothetical protein